MEVLEGIWQGNLIVIEFLGGHRFHFEDPDGYELAVWSAPAARAPEGRR